MACKLVIKNKYIQSVLGQSEFDTLDDFKNLLYSKFVLNPSAIPVNGNNSITLLRMSENADQSISVSLRTPTGVNIENTNIEYPEDIATVKDATITIPSKKELDGSVSPDVETFMKLWLGNYFSPNVTKLQNLVKDVIPKFLSEYSELLEKESLEAKLNPEKRVEDAVESLNFVESIIGENGLLNYYYDVLYTHYKNNAEAISRLNKRKEELTDIINKINEIKPEAERPLEIKYSDYSLISEETFENEEEQDAFNELKEIENPPSVDSKAKVVKSFSQPTTTFDSDVIDNIEVGKNILISLVNKDTREFRVVIAKDNVAFAQNRKLEGGVTKPLNVNQINTKNPSVAIVEVKEGNTWKRVYLKKDTLGRLKTSDLLKLDDFSLTTDPLQAYNISYELVEGNEVKTLTSPQLTLRSEQISKFTKEEKERFYKAFEESEKTGAVFFHTIRKGGKFLTRTYRSLKERGITISDIRIPVKGSLRGIPLVDYKLFDTGTLPENFKNEIKELLNYSYDTESEAQSVIDYLNSLIGVGDFVQEKEAKGSSRVNITRRTTAFEILNIDGEIKIGAIVYRYKDGSKFYYNSSPDKLEVLEYSEDNKDLIDKSLDAARIQIPKQKAQPQMSLDELEKVGFYPTRFAIVNGSLESIDWSIEEQHEFILENGKTHLTKLEEGAGIVDQIFFTDSLKKEIPVKEEEVEEETIGVFEIPIAKGQEEVIEDPRIGTLFDFKPFLKSLNDIQKLYKSLFDKNAKDTIIVYADLQKENRAAKIEYKDNSGSFTQQELNDRGIKVKLKPKQNINKIIYIDSSSVDYATTPGSALKNDITNAIVEEMIHALTINKIKQDNVKASKEYSRLEDAIIQLRNNTDVTKLTKEERDFFEYYVGRKGDPVTPEQVLEFMAAPLFDILHPIFEAANIKYPTEDNTSVLDYIYSLINNLKTYLSKLLLGDSPALQEKITADTLRIIIDKFVEKETFSSSAVIVGDQQEGLNKDNFEETIGVYEIPMEMGTEEFFDYSFTESDIEDIVKDFTGAPSIPETPPVSVDGEKPAEPKGEELTRRKGRGISGVKKVITKDDSKNLFTLVPSVKPKFSTPDKTEDSFRDLNVRKSAANHLDMLMSEYLFFEQIYSDFIFNKVSISELVEQGKAILKNEIDNPDISPERKNFLTYFYKNIETIWLENSKLLSIIDKELREEFSPESESDTTIDGEEKIGQDASESESNGGDSSSKFEERTEQKKSVLETIGVYAQHFVRMIPRIKTIDGVPQYETFEEDGVTYESPIYETDNFGNQVPMDYTTLWNTIADIVKGSLTIEEMIVKLENSFLKVPEVAIFIDRLKSIGASREDILLLKNLEKSLQKMFIPTEVMVQEEESLVGRDFTIFSQGRLDLINIQKILSSRFRTKFKDFISGVHVDYKSFNTFLQKSTGLSGNETSRNVKTQEKILEFWKENGINIPGKLPEDLSRKIKIQLYDFTLALIKKLNEVQMLNATNEEVNIKEFDLFAFLTVPKIAKKKVTTNGFIKNSTLSALSEVLPYSTSNMTKNAEGENQSNLHNFSSFLIYVKYINELYKRGEEGFNRITKAIPRLKNSIVEYSWTLNQIKNGAKITPVNLSGVSYENSGTNTINLDLIPYLQFQMHSLFINKTKENLRAETASTSFGFKVEGGSKALPVSDNVIADTVRIFEGYLHGEIKRIIKEKKEQYNYKSKYENKKLKFTFLDGVLSEEYKDKVYEIIDRNLDSDFKTILAELRNERQTFLVDLDNYRKKVRREFENYIEQETGRPLSLEHSIFTDATLSNYVRTVGYDAAIDMFLMNGVVLGIEEIILFHGEIGQFDKFYKRSKSTISNGTPVIIGKNLKTLLQTTLNGYTFSEILGGQRPSYYEDPSELKTATFSDDLMPLGKKQKNNLIKGIVNSLKLSAKSFGKKFNKKEAEEFAKKTVEQYDNANIGDGQGWIHPDAYRMILMGVDSWSPEREEGFIYLAIKEKKRRGFPLEEKDVQKLKEVEDKIKTKGYYFQFPDIKFQYRGGSVLTATVDGKEVDVEAPTAIEVLDKFALAPLFPEFAQNSIAEKMLDNMTKNNVAYTKFESATKIGGFEKNNLADLAKKDFKFKGVHKITTAFLKEQVKTPSKIKEKDSLGTQKRKLLISNLSIDGEFLEEMKPFYNLWKGSQRALAEKARKDLYADLGINVEDINNPNITIDLNKLVALLRVEADKRDLPPSLKAYFEKDFDPNEQAFFEMSLSPKLVENMLYSLLKNRIVKSKFPGSQLIQISSSLFNRTTNVNEDGRDLEFYRYDEQTGEVLPAQAKITLHGPFLNLLNLPEVKQAGGNLEALNTLLRDPEFRKKHKNVITVVSYRIPTQGYNSMDILEIVEFLPGYLGNTIVPPPQITVKSGTDYDYDKMPTIYPNIDKDGNYISHGNIDKSISQLSKEQYKERLVEVREKIKEAKENFKEKNKNAIETALTDINVPGEIVEENLDSKKLERLKTLKEHLMNEINSMKQDAEEIKGIIDELKPILNKNVSYKERARQYKEKYGEELDIKKQVEVRKKLYDGLAVLKDSITKNYELLGKLKDIKVEASETLQPLFEERDLLLRSRKIEALYANGLIEAAKGILLHPMNFHRLITPNNVSIVTEKIQAILERVYGTKNVNPEPVNTEIYSYTTHLKKWMAVKIKDLLGIAAVNNTFFSLMQEANFSFNEKIRINENEFDFNTPLLTEEERQSAKLTNPFLADSAIEKLEILNQFINLFVDAASNDIAGYTNLIRDNVGFVILQNDLGVPFDRTLALIHQPIIYRYNQLIKYYTGGGLSKFEAEKIAFEELLEIPTTENGFSLKNDIIWGAIKNEYDRLVPTIDLNSLNSTVIQKNKVLEFRPDDNQRALLLYYIVGIKQADALREAQSNVNYDTSPIQSYKLSVARENLIENIEDTGFVSVEAMEQIKNGVIGHLNIHNDLKFLSEILFPIKANPSYVEFVSKFFNSIPKSDLEKFINTFDNDFLMYIIQNYSPNFNQERYEYIKGLMSEGSLMNRWNELVTKYELQDTHLAKKLYPYTQKSGSANPAIFMGLDNDSVEFEAIMEEIKTFANPVGNSAQEIELKAFATDLMDLSFFQTGYNTGQIYMLKVMPPEYMDQFKEAFQAFKNLPEAEKDLEYINFYQIFKKARGRGIASSLLSYKEKMALPPAVDGEILINYIKQQEAQPEAQRSSQSQSQSQGKGQAETRPSTPAGEKGMYSYTFKDGYSIDLDFPLNKEQTEALEKMEDFFTNPSKYNNRFTLTGAAGTGKTTISSIFYRWVRHNKNVFPKNTSPTHKANIVTKAMIPGSDPKTLQSLLGLSPSFDFSKDIIDVRKIKFIKDRLEKIKEGDFLIVDECSMVEDGLFLLLEEIANDLNVKILYIGDSEQLNPTTQATPSKTFDNKNSMAVLSKVERTGDNAILKESVRVRNKEGLSYATEVNENGVGVTYFGEGESTLSIAKEYVSKMISDPNSDKNDFKILSASNEGADFNNKFLRKAVFGENVKQIEVGDLLTGFANLKMDYILNGYDYVVKSVRPATYTFEGMTFTGYKVVLEEDIKIAGAVNAGMSTAKHPKQLFIVDINEDENKLIEVARIKTELWNEYGRTKDRSILYQIGQIELNIVSMKDIFLGPKKVVEKGIDYGYALTIHKSQGSSYKRGVIVRDTIGKPFTEDEQNRLLYVAISRFREHAYVKTSLPTEYLEEKTKEAKKAQQKQQQQQQQEFSQKNIFTVNPKQSADKKAKAKASIATQFIGFAEGIEGSSTALYASQVGQYANTGNYSSSDVIFVSVGGKRGDKTVRKQQQDKTIIEAIKALEAGATLITDNAAYVESSDYNEGEKRLAANLKAKGYYYSETTVDGNLLGVWKKQQQQQPATKTDLGKINPTLDLSKTWKGDLESRPVYTSEGVNTMRTDAANPNEHFGNPFSATGYEGTRKVPDVKTAIRAYKEWLLTGYTSWLNEEGEAQDFAGAVEQRAWILDQINQGKLDTANLLYDKKLAERGQGTHAGALIEVVKELRGSQPTLKPQVPVRAGVEISSNSKGLAAALTNPTELAKSKGNLAQSYPIEFNGKTYKDVEEAYQELKDTSEEKTKPSKELSNNYKLMVDLLFAKLSNHPRLFSEITKQGGVDWILSSTHQPTKKNTVWETGGQNWFIEALADAYRIVEQSQSDVLFSRVPAISVKPGVEELFEENKELANAVYSVLGFSSLKESTIASEELLVVDEKEIPKKEGESFSEMQKRVSQNANIKKRIEIADKNNIIQGKSYSYFEIKKIFNNDKLFDNEIYKQLSPILESSNLTFRFGSLNKGKKTINAYYNSNSNSINIDTLVLNTPNLATSSFKRILLHEIIHAATFINLKEGAYLTSTQKTALNNLNNLIIELRKDKEFFGQYGLTNANELLAELANKEFVDKLKNKTFDENQSFFEKIISEVVKLLGLKTTAYDIVKESFDNLVLSYTDPTQITSQQKQQALQLYSSYLDTVFPDSKVKEIVYHGTDATFEKFMKLYNNIHFGTLKAAKERLATIKNQRKSSNENIYPVILDIKRPIITDADFDWELSSAGEQPDPYELISTVGYLDNWLYQNGYLPKEESDIFGLPDKSIPERVALWENHDAYIYKNFVEDKGSKSYSIFEPEQIHILGSKQDIEGFKEYVSKETQPEESLFNSSFTVERQKEIVSNFALKHKMSEEQAIENINQAVAQKGQQAIDKLKECY